MRNSLRTISSMLKGENSVISWRSGPPSIIPKIRNTCSSTMRNSRKECPREWADLSILLFCNSLRQRIEETQFLKYIIIAVMLSYPIPSLMHPEANSSSIKVYSIWTWVRFFGLCLFFVTHFTIFYALFLYQIPSQPIRMNYRLFFYIFMISGTAITICSVIPKFLLLLSIKSPSALLKLSVSLMRPSMVTNPPAFSILAFSLGFNGL